MDQPPPIKEKTSNLASGDEYRLQEGDADEDEEEEEEILPLKKRKIVKPLSSSEENEMGGMAEKEGPTWRKPHLKTGKQTNTLIPQVSCPVPSCNGKAINLNCHLRVKTEAHLKVDVNDYLPETRMADGGAQKRSYRGRFVCCVCGVDTIRMDVHVIKQHDLSRKDPVFNTKLEECKEIVLQDKGATHLLRALNEYGNSMKDRASGSCARGNTVQSHLTTVRFFLGKLDPVSMAKLERIGEADGFIDTQLKEKR